ncbi:MAG: hypothetical protein R3B09_07240 [Nannocystaceae bacterium]
MVQKYNWRRVCLLVGIAWLEVQCTGADPPAGTATGASATSGDEESTSATEGTTAAPGGPTTGVTGSTSTSTSSTTGDATVTAATGESTGVTTVDPDPTCDDGILNEDESDVDCGGAHCPACGAGLHCVVDGDCFDESCVQGVCVVPSCDDGVANGDESDVDCGGPCPPCGDGLFCGGSDECQSEVCQSGVCAPPNCGDGVQNGGESDVDCGRGDHCTGCAEGAKCEVDEDCLSDYCVDGLCAAAACQKDSECAAFDGPCTKGQCTKTKTCAAVPANEGIACDDGDLCTVGEACGGGVCGGADPVDCSGLNQACVTGVCDPDSGQCEAKASNGGNPCDDGDPCTIASVCKIGECLDPYGPLFIRESFPNNANFWLLGSEWQIKAAAPSNCSAGCGGDDPALDHTPTPDNGVAGVSVGGCPSTAVHAYSCLTSQAIDTSQFPPPFVLSWWQQLHNQGPMSDQKVEVWDGVQWNSIWTSPPACYADVEWVKVQIDVSMYKGKGIRLRYCHQVSQPGAPAAGGWSVDDIVVAAPGCDPIGP